MPSIIRRCNREHSKILLLAAIYVTLFVAERIILSSVKAVVVSPEVLALRAEGRFEMGRKRHKPAEIIAKFRQVDVLIGSAFMLASLAEAIGESSRREADYISISLKGQG